MKRLSKSKIHAIKLLAKKQYSLNKIRKKTRIPKTTVYYHVKKLIKKVKQVKIEKLSNWDKGYLVGFFVGDGHLDFRKNNYSYRVVFSLNKKKDRPIAERLTKIIIKARGNPYKIEFKSLLRIICISKVLFNFLRQFVIYKRIQKGKKMINKKVGIKNIAKEGREFNFGFISGLIDSDGCVGPDRTSIRILICSYFESIIQETHKILKNLGLISYIQFDNKRNCWILRISTPYFKQNYSKIKCIKGSWSIGKTLPSQIPE